MKFPIKDFSCKCDQIRRKLRIWSNLQEKSLMGNSIFCAVWHLKSSLISDIIECKDFWDFTILWISGVIIHQRKSWPFVVVRSRWVFQFVWEKFIWKFCFISILCKHFITYKRNFLTKQGHNSFPKLFIIHKISQLVLTY